MCFKLDNKKEKVHFLDSEFYKVCTKHFCLICFIMLFIDVIFVLLQFAFCMKGLVLACLIPTLELMFFFIFKNELDAKKAKKIFWFYAFFIFFFLAITINCVVNTCLDIPLLNRIIIGFLNAFGFFGWLILLTQEEFRLSIA